MSEEERLVKSTKTFFLPEISFLQLERKSAKEIGQILKGRVKWIARI
jgi:hypothetical protein